MTREEAIQILSTRDKYGVPCGYTSGYQEALDMAIEALHKTKWIPISEKLPETGDSILVTYSDEEVGIVWSARPKVWGKYEKANNLIFPVAWMPLPEPYREDGEDEPI